MNAKELGSQLARRKAGRYLHEQDCPAEWRTASSTACTCGAGDPPTTIGSLLDLLSSAPTEGASEFYARALCAAPRSDAAWAALGLAAAHRGLGGRVLPFVPQAGRESFERGVGAWGGSRS